jgi:O-antigen/teichoic acid export membrane protein
MARPSPSSPSRPGGESESAYRPRQSLTGAVVTGVRWKLVSQVLREGTRLAIGILLARLLTPAEWGVAGMALAVVAFMAVLSEFALPHALVQRARITEADRSALFWTSLTLGFAVASLGIALSGFVADFFGEPQVQFLFAAACVGIAISSLEKVPGALLTRDFAFRSLEVRQIAATITGAVVALILALAGAGSWAIIGNWLGTTTVSCLLLWLMTTWRPRLVFEWESFRNLLGFGGPLLGTQLLSYFQVNADKLLVGRYLGASALGAYAFAYQLMFAPIMNITFPLQGVLFPVFASIQDDKERLKAAWLRGKRLAVALVTPVFLTLAVVAPDLIPLLFGEKWDDAIPVLQLLCLAGVAYSFGTQNWILLVVKGKVRILFFLTLLIAVVTTAAAAIGLRWGIVGVAATYAIAHWALVIPEMWVATRAGSIGFWETLRATCSPLPFAFAAAAAAYGLRSELVAAEMPAATRVVIVGLVFVSLYASLAYIGSTPLRNELRRAVKRLRHRTSREDTGNAYSAP